MHPLQSRGTCDEPQWVVKQCEKPSLSLPRIAQALHEPQADRENPLRYEESDEEVAADDDEDSEAGDEDVDEEAAAPGPYPLVQLRLPSTAAYALSQNPKPRSARPRSLKR